MSSKQSLASMKPSATLCGTALWIIIHSSSSFTTLCSVIQSGSNNIPSSSLDKIQVMVIVWRLRRNIIRTALCWIVWHNVHSQKHTYMSSSYRSNRLGLSHWDPYTMHRGGCLELLLLLLLLHAKIKVTLSQKCCRGTVQTANVTYLQSVTTDAVMFGHHWKIPWTAAVVLL